MSTYRLEILPLYEGHPYKNITDRDNTNAGFDLYCPIDGDVENVALLLPLGVKVRLVQVTECEEIDSHYWLLPRSSIYKTGFMMANSVGVIDKSYRGELKAPIIAVGHNEHKPVTKVGERYFQIVAPDMGWIKEVRVVGELPETSRGAGGFGSTGK
jgi:deoxyuridine 5'-triphosphate nucleotidohydrolase